MNSTNRDDEAFADEGGSLEVTREQAAELLHVSPAYVDELVRGGRLAYFKSDPPLLARKTVLAYRHELKKRQAQGLDNMVQASERLGLYDNEQAPSTSTPPVAAPLNAVYLAQARSLPGLLERLLTATPPDSLERCELVARLENLLELFEPAADDSNDLDPELSDGSTP